MGIEAKGENKWLTIIKNAKAKQDAILALQDLGFPHQRNQHEAD